MRVGVTGPLFPDSLADNLLSCLVDLGVTAIPLGPIGPKSQSRYVSEFVAVARRLGYGAEEFTQRSLVTRAKRAKCDLVINILQSLTPSTVREIRRFSDAVVLWFPDCVANAGRLSLAVADYNVVFLKDRLFAERLREVYGVPAYYLPEACNPHWHRPVGDPGCQPYIAVVGNIYATRARLLQRLHAAGVPLRLFGGGFPRWLDAPDLRALHSGRFVMREEKARVFREARGVLNNLHPAEMDSVNCRLFEAAASGGAVLCEDRESLSDLFDSGEQVLKFESFDELVDQCRRLLDDPTYGAQIGDAASVRAHTEHTYQHRLRSILSAVRA